MTRSLQIGRFRQVPVSVDIGLALAAVVFVATLAIEGMPRLDPDAGLGLRVAVASVAVGLFLGSVLAHEFGHALVARRWGVGVRGITLSLFGGYAQLDRQAPHPRAEFTIAAAGPGVNLVIAAAVAGLAWVANQLGVDDRLVLGSVLWLAAVNLVLALVNLVPASPLDGGRLVTAGLWKRWRDPERARVATGRAGIVLGAVLVPLGLAQLWWSDWRGLVTSMIGVFLFQGARGEILAATIRGRLARTEAHQVMVTDPPSVPDSLTVDQLWRFAGRERRGVAFPVVRWGTEPIGYVVPADGATLDDAARSWTTVVDLMRPTPEVARAWVTESLDAVLQRQPGASDLVVVLHEPRAGAVVGTLSAGQLDPVLRSPDLWGREKVR